MYQAILDIELKKSNGSLKNYVMATNLIADLNTLETQIDTAIKIYKRSYNNLPVCQVTIIVFDITNKVITHYKDIDIKQYTYNEPIMTTAEIPVINIETVKKDYSNLFIMYEYALIEMQKKQ